MEKKWDLETHAMKQYSFQAISMWVHEVSSFYDPPFVPSIQDELSLPVSCLSSQQMPRMGSHHHRIVWEGGREGGPNCPTSDPTDPSNNHLLTRPSGSALAARRGVQSSQRCLLVSHFPNHQIWGKDRMSFEKHQRWGVKSTKSPSF